MATAPKPEVKALLEMGTGYDDRPGPQQAITPMELIQVAVNQNADITKLEKLMELQLRWEANEARKSFVAAMAAFKADPPEIVKNKTVTFGQTSYDHATLDQVCRQVTQGLSKHDISHRWRIEQSDSLIRVTCILTHALGHSEETTLVAGADQSGSKNAIQAIGSAVTYLERYTLLAATGLAAKNGDNDGKSTGPVMETLQVHLDRIAGSEDLAMLDRAFKDAFKEATALMATDAMKKLVAKKDEVKAKLQKAHA